MTYEALPLGKRVQYVDQLDARLLCGVPRSTTRSALGISTGLPFSGVDRWRCYELSWLTSSNIPRVAELYFEYPCESPQLLESKSLKLYLGSFAGTVFPSPDEVRECITEDLSGVVGGQIERVELHPPGELSKRASTVSPGVCLEDSLRDLPGAGEGGLISPNAPLVEERLFTNLFRSLCPVTGQPDLARVEIQYAGAQMNRGVLLQHLLAFRSTQGFGEDCCERITLHLMEHSQPSALSVSCAFYRRGGIDITPVRSKK